MRAVETNAFDGKCPAYIEGCRFVPFGETWIRSDGEVFEGEAMFPFVNSEILQAYQTQYEAMQAEIKIREEALEILGVSADD
jgi:hypothetical protein